MPRMELRGSELFQLQCQSALFHIFSSSSRRLHLHALSRKASTRGHIWKGKESPIDVWIRIVRIIISAPYKGFFFCSTSFYSSSSSTHSPLFYLKGSYLYTSISCPFSTYHVSGKAFAMRSYHLESFPHALWPYVDQKIAKCNTHFH